MKEVLLVLLYSVLYCIAELVFEVFFQLIFEGIIALIMRSVRNVFDESNQIRPALAVMGYFLLGIAFGIPSLRLYPHPIFHPSQFHGISLIISPVVTGLVMSQVGAFLRRKGKQAVRIESFGYGFSFALGLAIVRFLFVN